MKTLTDLYDWSCVAGVRYIDRDGDEVYSQPTVELWTTRSEYERPSYQDAIGKVKERYWNCRILDITILNMSYHVRSVYL